MEAKGVLRGLVVLGLLVGIVATAAARMDPEEPDVPVRAAPSAPIGTTSLLGAAPSAPLGTSSPLGEAFTYQGELQDAGGLVDGACDLRFRLWDAASGGSQVGSTLTLTSVAVTGGRFTAQLDFGASAFQGEACWLEVGVRCPAGSGSYIWLSPRQPVTASPYALYALRAPWSGLSGVPPGLGDGDDDTTYTAGTGLTLSGTQFSLQAAYRLPQGCSDGQIAEWNGANWVCAEDEAGGCSDHDHWGQTWSGSGTGLRLESPDGVALFAYHNSASGDDPGVQGVTASQSDQATGVLGIASPTVAGNFSAGVRGVNNSTGDEGVGVMGYQQGSGVGVYGYSPDGWGVWGFATGTSSENCGVGGLSLSVDGTGVFGQHNNTAGTKPGVEGLTASRSIQATAVLGTVHPSDPGSWSAAVRGINNGTGANGIGVYGEQKGSGWGVYGTSESGYAGYFDGDVEVTGNCVGCVLAYIGLNDSPDPLETGDLVAISGVSEPPAGASVPLLRVRRAGAASGGALLGVMQSRGRLAGTQHGPDREVDNVVRAEGPAAPGDYVFIVVQGLSQVKADARLSAIQPGDMLAVAGSPTGHAARALDGSAGLQVGRAMESLEQGSGLIWVMVDLQGGRP